MTDCTLCELPTPDPPVTDADVEGTYCCRGCLEVARTLGDVTEVDATTAREAVDTGPDAADVEGAETFLSVDGMHCATCETFVASRATRHEGVHAASASYPTGAVKLVHDPDLDRDALVDLIDGLGYRARPPDADAVDDGAALGRLLVGGFFGMMVMLWYLLFLYPHYVGFDLLAGLVDLSGTAGTYLLWNVWLITSVVLGYTGFPLLRGAYVSLRARQPNMDLLVALAATTAYLYSTVTLLRGGLEVYFDVAIVIVLAVTVGTYYEDRVRRRTAGRLGDLTEERVDEARRRTGDGHDLVPIESLAPGDAVVVRAGERVPVDGTVVEGEGAVDESLVTGESLPVRKAPGDEVVGGGLLTSGGLTIEVGADATSTLDRLVAVLWEVQSGRSGVQRLADRVARVFVPVVLGLALVAVGWQLATGAALDAAILTGLSVLVVSCPCALGLATPLATTAGLRTALDRGVVVTDTSAFERAPDAATVAFDKTGTLTTGEMRVVEVVGGEAVRENAAAVERFADHPVADAIAALGGDAATVSGFETHPGLGVSAAVDGEPVVVGRPDLFAERGWRVPDDLADRCAEASAAGQIPSLVGWGGDARGVVVCGDTPRPEWDAVVTDLSRERRVVVITGDREPAAEQFRDHPAVDEVFVEVPPEAKAEVVSRLDGPVAMVGDGSNDAPALAAADIGISLARGTRLAADAADAVVTTDDLGAVPTVFAVTQATKRRVRENLAWAFLYNAVALPAAVAGLLNPLVAAVAMATSSLLVVVNSARPLTTDDSHSPGGDDTPPADGDDTSPTDPDDPTADPTSL
ncbi:heavy metal translocating P-type ATPase [Halorarius litoreus]|uniref:heavy metal translocating P-type ATPase n=1 Tax=Halorarius litoreus TaxID=2962676 RepID=UPI0020CD2E4D|nr:cation-translocating P-type ATPase [Halorarius litoreus]